MKKIISECEILKSCPRCGGDYYGYPFFSIADDVTPICHSCGIRERFTLRGYSADEIEELLRPKYIPAYPIELTDWFSTEPQAINSEPLKRGVAVRKEVWCNQPVILQTSNIN